MDTYKIDWENQYEWSQTFQKSLSRVPGSCKLRYTVPLWNIRNVSWNLKNFNIQGLLPQITTNFFVHPRSLIYGSTPKNHYPDFNRPEITCSPQVLTRDPHLMRLLPEITASALPETWNHHNCKILLEYAIFSVVLRCGSVDHSHRHPEFPRSTQ